MSFIEVSLTIFVCLTLGEIAESSLDDDMKIVGGQQAKKSYPYQLSLQIYRPKETRKYTHFCGASILSENYLITAAHCIEPVNISDVSALAGVSDLRKESEGSRHQLLWCEIHPNYTELVSSDIALCKVQLPFVYDDKIAKIDISREYFGPNVDCTLTGWGSVLIFRYLPIPFYTLFAYPDNLQEVHLPTMSNEDCNRTYSFNPIDETQVCTLSRIFRGACAGDSGGPLVHDGQLVGIVSYATAICTVGFPDVFTRVSYFYDWITSNTDLSSAVLTKESEIHSIISSLPDVLKGD